MKYLLLIYEAESVQANRTEEEFAAMMKAYFAFNDEARTRGVLVGGDALQPIATATSVRRREGKVVTTDGPFAETKEQLGGYYLVEAKDLDEAIELAAKIPSAETGTIEVRPIMTFEE